MINFITHFVMNIITHPCWDLSSLQWGHNECNNVSNHQPRDCLLNRLFRRRSKKTSKLRVTGLCAGNSPGTGEFPTQMASNEENVSFWWRHHVFFVSKQAPVHLHESKPLIWICMSRFLVINSITCFWMAQIDGLVQGRCNSSASFLH